MAPQVDEITVTSVAMGSMCVSCSVKFCAEITDESLFSSHCVPSMENSWRRILSLESRLSAASTDESGYDGDSSGERSPWLFQATSKILTELDKLATSQRRIEGMLVNVARITEDHREHLKMLRNLEFDFSSGQGPVELPTLPGLPRAKSEAPAVQDPSSDLGRGDALGLDLGPVTVGPRVSREDNLEEEAMFARSCNPEDNRADHRKQTFKVLSPLRSSVAQRKSVEFVGAKETSHGITSMCGTDFVSLHLPSSWPSFPLRPALARGARLNELELHATTMARFPGGAEQLVGGEVCDIPTLIKPKEHHDWDNPTINARPYNRYD